MWCGCDGGGYDDDGVDDDVMVDRSVRARSQTCA